MYMINNRCGSMVLVNSHNKSKNEDTFKHTCEDALKSAKKRIIHNKIKCNKCGDIIESCSGHDFKYCSCGACAVDGGHDYLRRLGKREDWEELAELERAP